MGDYGIKASIPGVDVEDATPDQLLFSSKYPMLKIKVQASTTITIAKTQLNGAINASQTTITVDSTTNFPSSGYFWTFSAASGVWEAIAYTGKTATTFTGCTRGHLGTTGRICADNAVVVQGSGTQTISHGLTYPPVHLVYNLLSGAFRLCPKFLDEFGENYIENYVDTSNLVISVVYSNNSGVGELSGPPIPSGSTETYTFYYTIMYDSILTPYY